MHTPLDKQLMAARDELELLLKDGRISQRDYDEADTRILTLVLREIELAYILAFVSALLLTALAIFFAIYFRRGGVLLSVVVGIGGAFAVLSCVQAIARVVAFIFGDAIGKSCCFAVLVGLSTFAMLALIDVKLPMPLYGIYIITAVAAVIGFAFQYRMEDRHKQQLVACLQSARRTLITSNDASKAI